MRTIRIGEGAGYSGAWIEPAVELAEHGHLQYLCFEALAERTLALAQIEYTHHPDRGFDPFLEPRFEKVLPPALRNGVRIVTNMGSANPMGAARKVIAVARRLGIPSLRVAIVLGDDVRDIIRQGSYTAIETGENLSRAIPRMVSANAYLGAGPIVQALNTGAQVVITGRVADPALALACVRYEFGWPSEDWARIGTGTAVGHLLECSGQVTGGYFADPGYKDVVGLGHIGYPIAEVSENGDLVITKVPESGGAVTERTCKEQILYEVHDPSAYLTPDVTADFSHVTCRQIGPDRVRLSGASGKPRPETLKVSVGLRAGYIGEGQISYGGPGAYARAQLAADMIRERLAALDFSAKDVRVDFIGVNSLFGDTFLPPSGYEPLEVRLRVAARVETPEKAAQVGNTVEALWILGPSGGAGATKSVREVIQILSTLVDRRRIEPQVRVEVLEL